MVRQACAGVVVLSLSACASTLPYGQPVSTEQHVFSTNFSVGAEKSCPVGDVMVRVKDYYTLTTSKTAWTTEVPVLIHLVLGKAQLPPGVYPVVSRKQMENEQFDVIQPPFGGALLVDQSGRIRKEMNGLENIGYDVTVTPADFRLNKGTDVKVDAARGYVNFELIYTGILSGTIRITYREYSPEDFARTAFFQDLTYSADQRTIRFRDILLGVESATNEAIKFKVLHIPTIWVGLPGSHGDTYTPTY